MTARARWRWSSRREQQGLAGGGGIEKEGETAREGEVEERKRSGIQYPRVADHGARAAYKPYQGGGQGVAAPNRVPGPR